MSLSSLNMLKRPRRDAQSNNIPQLPQISIDLTLDVFTHVSLRREGVQPEDFGDNERLSMLGKAVLDAVVTNELFKKRPMINALQVRVK